MAIRLGRSSARQVEPLQSSDKLSGCLAMEEIQTSTVALFNRRGTFLIVSCTVLRSLRVGGFNSLDKH